ncbi:MAG: hypothetical protein MJ180_00225 [Candidatus Gastranaerophilales bacterium]|nr:hypothetical protein [Candidatus Gastranaerophilales bacterium]
MTDISVKNGGFTPELWSAKLNATLDDHGKYMDIVNHKYEGEIKSKGDKVYFYTLGSLTVSDYNPTATGFSGITYQDPTGDKQALEISQQKIIPFLVDDIQKVQSNIDLVNQYINRIAVAASQTKDKYIHGLAVANATTKLHTDSALQLTKDNVWAEVCKMYSVLGRKNALINGVDYAGKRPALVVTPEIEGVIKQCSQFFANAVGAEVLRKGQIGTLGGFDVFVDTNIATDKTGTGSAAVFSQTMVALTSDAITYAEQITKTETLRDKDQVGDFVRCLLVYGGQVANPDCIVTSKVTGSFL